MDQFDRAQALEMAQREEAIANARFGALESIPGAVTALVCLECGCDIPQARREALPGVMRCVDCQQDFEKDQKRGLR